MTFPNTAPRDVTRIPMRPVDKIIKGRREAISKHMCANGAAFAREGTCVGNQTAYVFNTAADFKEYMISGFCQDCQIRFFGF